LTIRVRSTSDVSPGFFNTDTVTVQSDGTFSGSFDFSEQSAGDTFDVTVRKGGTQVASADGEVVESVSEETPTATATEQPDTETETATATATEAPDTETEAPDTETEEPDTETTTTTTPGFGVAVALVALLAAALLAGRRE
ncbi:BGTF surface domain-containing protein, partial [Halolamina salina]